MNYEQALKVAAEIVESSPVVGKRDKADPRNGDSFYVRYERGGSEHVTLEVRMKLVTGQRPMRFKLEVGTSFAAAYRSLEDTRRFMQLLTEVTTVGERVEVTLADHETFSVEI